MFIVCNYLDVSGMNNIPDGFAVEECGSFDQSLEGYCIICREHKIPLLKEWAATNMGQFYKMFKKQFGVNPKKAMKFIAKNGKIGSFTEEFVNSCGGLENFKEMYCKDSVQPLVKPGSDELQDSQPQVTNQELSETQEPQEPELKEEQMEAFLDEDPVQAQEECSLESQEVEAAGMPKTVEEPATSQAAKECQRCVSCIFNEDGSFKGFTEGQVISMLQTLRDLDKRIALDTLDVDYVMDEEEIKQASGYLDKVAPSVFKGFMMDLLQRVESDTDYIRVSVLLDKFSYYLSSLNRK